MYEVQHQDLEWFFCMGYNSDDTVYLNVVHSRVTWRLSAGIRVEIAAVSGFSRSYFLNKLTNYFHFTFSLFPSVRFFRLLNISSFISFQFITLFHFKASSGRYINTTVITLALAIGCGGRER